MAKRADPNLIVIGNGMVGHRLLELLVERNAQTQWNIIAFCEEPRLAYDRVHLSEFFSGRTAALLSLVAPDYYRDHGVAVRVGERAESIDRSRRVVRGQSGGEIPYDKIVLATGSRPFVPPVAGGASPGCFVYRTIEDLEAIGRFAAGCQRGVVIGGGLLGLEAANALRNMNLATHIVELAPRLMALQLDGAGGALLRRLIEQLGVGVHAGKQTVEITASERGVRALRFADGGELAADMVVFSAGIRPRDELARGAGLAVAQRGGIVVDDHCRTSDPDIFAIGECAAWNGQCFGLVGPGYQMAQVAADQLTGTSASAFTGADLATKLKLLGVDVASFGDAHGTTPESRTFSLSDELRGQYKKIVLSRDGKRLLGGILVGDAAAHPQLLSLFASRAELPDAPEVLVLPDAARSAPSLGGADLLAESAQVCSCNNVSKGAICSQIAAGATEVGEIKKRTKAGTGCGGCIPLLTAILGRELAARGIEVSRHTCEHFPHARQELFHLVRVKRIKTFDQLLADHGRGSGCEICKPAVTSILAACWNEHVLEPEHAPLQDTNDFFLANMQRDGTYSIIPRVPGGEITPDKLIALGQVGKKYDLYTKITGAQRIDLFGAKLHQLPAIWAELVAAGFESGHAYGKALRTVKSCVGSTWCRYGVQDSVGLAVRLENRYKGLRAPHKLKMAVSGCARECAEAQSKDVGVIATEAGYNIYVCGNGGIKPRHADLFATDLDEATLVRYIDRFLMFYIRTADRLQRTARWLEQLEGGLEYLKKVIIEDALGLGDELEAQMAHIVGTYQCEWKATLEDPVKIRRFRTFVNDDREDDSLLYVRERGQRRPAYAHERTHLVVVK